MKLKVEIDLGNAAFDVEDDNQEHIEDAAAGQEIARILRKLAERIEDTTVSEGDKFTEADFNGNTVLSGFVE